MPISEKDRDQIDKHLFSQLSEEEQKAFKELSKNKAFQEELELAEDLMPVFKKEGRQQLKTELKAFESELQENRSEVKVVSIKRRLSIAAAVVFLIVAGYNLLSTGNKTENLYAQYYETYPNVVDPIVKGETETYSSFQLYELKEFQKAYDQFSAEPKNEVNSFYKGICAIELEENEAAFAALRAVTEYENGKFGIPANYYLGLLHLKLGEAAPAQMYLELVAQNSENVNLQKRAKELLSAL